MLSIIELSSFGQTKLTRPNCRSKLSILLTPANSGYRSMTMSPDAAKPSTRRMACSGSFWRTRADAHSLLKIGRLAACGPHVDQVASCV